MYVLPRHEKGGGCAVGQNVPDKALTARENVHAPTKEQRHAAGRFWAGQESSLEPKRGACLRGNAFGYEPVRLKFGRGKVHAVTGVAICRQVLR